MDAVATEMILAVAGGAAIIASAPAQIGAAICLVNLTLRLGYHAVDALDEDIGSDGSMPNDRAAAAGFRGQVAGMVAINLAVAINHIKSRE